MVTDRSYVIAPERWTPNDPNPFSPDGQYGLGWSSIQIHQKTDPGMASGTSPRDLYCFIISHSVANLKERLGDFLQYENQHGRTVIVACPSKVDAHALVKDALANNPDSHAVRPSDPHWGVHSTTADGWTNIQQCGELLSMARLRRDADSMTTEQWRECFEPADYAEYVMLGSLAEPDVIVASHGAGEMVADETAPYTPGMRLYFDAHLIIRSGLVTRDGLHIVKVYEHLPLAPYLVTAIGVENVDPQGEVETWTPRTFVSQANQYFFSYCHCVGPSDMGC